jgi:hypothetical protein
MGFSLTQNIIANEYTSLEGVYFLPPNSSGAFHPIVPTKFSIVSLLVFVSNLASPKSAIFTSQLCEI